MRSNDLSLGRFALEFLIFDVGLGPNPVILVLQKVKGNIGTLRQLASSFVLTVFRLCFPFPCPLASEILGFTQTAVEGGLGPDLQSRIPKLDPLYHLTLYQHWRK